MTDIYDTLNERGARYGDFTDHARIAQQIQDCYEFGWWKLNPVQRQALTVIADKIARIISGDPNYDDSWRDIIGYATLVLERLPNVSAPHNSDNNEATAPGGSAWGGRDQDWTPLCWPEREFAPQDAVPIGEDDLERMAHSERVSVAASQQRHQELDT